MLCHVAACGTFRSVLEQGFKYFKWAFIFHNVWVMDDRVFKFLNLALIVLYPIAWLSPLISAGLLPLFGLDQISIVSGIVSMWDSDPILALVIIAFAIVAPMVKTLGQAMVDFRGKTVLPKWASVALARFAMADVFLIALYITVIKGIGLGHVQTEWGIYLFTACVIVSVVISLRQTQA